MQDAINRGWISEPPVSTELRASVRSLNKRFLELLIFEDFAWNAAWREPAGAVRARFAPLSAQQRAAAADCPYALFDLRFDDERHWRSRLALPGPAVPGHAAVAEESPAASRMLAFSHLALFFAWHVANAATQAAPLLLGMSGATAAYFRATPLDTLSALAATEASHLSARWCGCASYWDALAAAAARADGAALRRVQLSGLQLAAAARLPVARGESGG
jgi:hypothetical protein